MKQKYIKWLVWVLVPVVLVVVGKGCIKQVNHQITNQAKIYHVEPVEHEKGMDITIEVVAKNTKREFLQGYLENAYVKVGDEVKKGDKLAKSRQGNTSYVCKASSDGVVIGIYDEYVLLAQGGYQLRFVLTPKQKECLSIGQNVLFRSKNQEYQLEITDIANTVIQENGSNGYVVYAMMDDMWDYGMVQSGWLVYEQDADAIVIPMECIITIQEESYVIFSSWLEHVGTMNHDDYEKITIIDADVSGVQVQQMPKSAEVIMLDDESYVLASAYLKEQIHD